MSHSNKSLLQKADVAIADLAAGGGLLLPEQSTTFIRTLMDSPTLLSAVRVVPMNSPERKVDKIGFGQRILRAGQSGVALTQAQRSKPTFGQVTLNTKEVIAEVRIPYDVMEDNIERSITATNNPSNSGAGGLQTTIVQMIAERASIDLEELLILGDTANVDPYLALMDGYLKLCNAHVVDSATAAISRALLVNGVKAMPDKYMRNRAQMLQMFSPNNETDLREVYATRQTALGDANTQGTAPLFIHGSRVAAVPQMPSDSGLFTNPNNLLMGIQRQISLEFDKSITERTYIVVLTARVACAVEEVDAAVRYDNIG